MLEIRPDIREKLQAAAEEFTGPECDAEYAWVILVDHLYTDQQLGGDDDAGQMGPSNGPSRLYQQLLDGEGHEFKLYCDGEDKPCYTGRLVTTGDMAEHCAAPLDDFGKGWAGCTDVRWPGHPEWGI